MHYGELAARWAQANLANDFIFNKTFLDPGLTRELLSRILPDLHLSQFKILNTQHELVSTYDAKGLRFDIYAEEQQGNHFDIEMQVRNQHSLPQRIRFYQSTLAMDSYERGEDYRQASNAYVIFFCCFDPFGLGDQYYRIQRGIDSGADYHRLTDGEMTLCFDVTSLRKTVSPPVQNFLDLLVGRKVEGDDDFIVQLRKRIAYVKQNRKWRREYMLRTLYEMDLEHDRQQAIEEDIKKGIKQGVEKGIKKGLQEGRAEGRTEGRTKGRAEGHAKGRTEGQKEGQTNERLDLVCDLINSGQTAEEVQKFLINIRKWSPAQARDYYQRALTKLRH